MEESVYVHGQANNWQSFRWRRYCVAGDVAAVPRREEKKFVVVSAIRIDKVQYSGRQKRQRELASVPWPTASKLTVELRPRIIYIQRTSYFSSAVQHRRLTI